MLAPWVLPESHFPPLRKNIDLLVNFKLRRKYKLIFKKVLRMKLKTMTLQDSPYRFHTLIHSRIYDAEMVPKHI